MKSTRRAAGQHPILRATRRTVLVGAAATLAVGPGSVRAQGRDRRQRLVVLTAGGARAAVLGQTLAELGWHHGRLRFDSMPVQNDIQAQAVLALEPDVVVATGQAAARRFSALTRTTPLVFVDVPDPVGAGIVASRERPGGNVTGVSSFEPPTIRRWLEMLGQIAPAAKRVAVLFNPAEAPSAPYMLRILQEAAPAHGMSVRPALCRTEAEIKQLIASLAAEDRPGLVSLFNFRHRDAIHALAAQHRVPTVHPFRMLAMRGGLMSHGHDFLDLSRRAGITVDRILRGANPAELPVQQEEVFETTIDRKAADAIGVSFSPALVATAEASARQAQRRNGSRRFVAVSGGGFPSANAYFGQAVAEAGWHADKLRFEDGYVSDLVSLAPDVIVLDSGTATFQVKQQTNSIPIVGAGVGDVVGQGLVDSLARPGGNLTGFINWDPSFNGKSVGMLTQIAPRVEQVTVMFHPAVLNWYISATVQAVEEAARAAELRVDVVNATSEADIKAIVETLARRGMSGLLVTASPGLWEYQAVIPKFAAEYRVPAIYPHRDFARSGGLLSFGPDFNDVHRRAAGYVDRILKGESPAEMPIQLPTKYETHVNLKAATALGVTISPTLLAAADEVIE